MPALTALVEKEKVRQQKDDSNRNLGFSQAFEYGKRSSEEYVGIPLVFYSYSSIEPPVLSGYQRLRPKLYG